MKIRPALPLIVGVLLASAAPAPVAAAADDYPPHPDTLAKSGVPKGDLLKLEFAASRIFPGTTRELTVYVP